MKKQSIICLSVGLILCLVLTCTFEKQGSAGSLLLNFPMKDERTLTPDIDMTPSSYTITGTGPDGATFAIVSTDESELVSDLAFGTWHISVQAVNGGDFIIGEGAEDAVVHVGETTSVTVVVAPLPGYGTLDLTVNWNEADTDYPTIQSHLMPRTGDPLDLAFTVSNGNLGTCSATAIPTGYYNLIVKLMDGNPANTTPLLTMGAVEVVRIVKDQTTNGIFDFTEINVQSGSIQVNITPQMGNPLPVMLSGQQDQIDENGSMTVAVSIPEDVGNVTYVWYINGESQATGETYTVSGLSPGEYRLDVTAYTTDNKRAGSAMWNFRVTNSSVINEEKWVTGTEMPTRRDSLTSAVVDGIIYVIGGAYEMQISGQNTVEAYDPAADAWSSKAAMPTLRYALSSAEVNGIIYVIGGLHSGSALSTVEAYNPTTNTWTTKSSMPTARANTVCEAVNGVIYVIGGCSPNPSWAYFNTVEAYDTATDTWSIKTSMPTSRTFSGGAVMDNIIYVIGGCIPSATYDIVEAYDTLTDTWSTKAPISTARVGLTACVVKGNIYTIGGTVGSSALNLVEAYNPVTNTWITKKPMPTARYFLTTDEVNNIIYAIGGADVNDISIDTMEVYIP